MSKGYLQDDYNDATYDMQYDDGHASDGVQLNHHTLYVTNIPKGLTSDGLKAAFTKFGTVARVFLNKDPRKRYAMVSFETPSEAKSAMMKLNQTEPLRLCVNIAHCSNKRDTSIDTRERRYNRQRDGGSSRDDCSYGRQDRSQEEMANGDNDFDDICNEDMTLDPDMHPEVQNTDLPLELERLRLKHLKLQEAQVQCMQRMLLLNSKKTKTSSMNTNANRSILPDGRIVVRNSDENNENDYMGSGAGDSKGGESVCSCKAKLDWWEASGSSDDGTSTPSTCVLCSEDRSDTRMNEGPDKSELTSRTDTRKSHSISDSKYKAKFTNTTKSKSVTSKTTEFSSKKSEYSKTDVGKSSDVTSKRIGVKRLVKQSEGTCEFKYSDLYSDSDYEVDETNRLIELRATDYLDVVEDHLRVIVALAGYPKAKMRLQQMELFQRSIEDVMDMQLKAGLLKRAPTFLDYYLNRGAIVCICKDLDTRDWLVRISPGLQERMCNNIVLLKARMKRLCLAVLKIPHTCWPTTAQDAFKLLQYFNPTLRTNLWRIYAQKTIRNIECTSFLLDRISGEIIRGPSFKNIIDYNQMEFELTGYSEIYYECLLSDMDEDLRSVASRVKLLDEIRSNGSTPRNAQNENETLTIGTKKDEQEKEESESVGVEIEEIVDSSVCVRDVGSVLDNTTAAEDIKKDLENSVQKDILRKLKDVKYISDKDEIIVWNEEPNLYESEQNVNVQTIESEANNNNVIYDMNENAENDTQRTSFYISDNNESIYESNETLMSRNSNVNIDSNRGMAYYRRTNYLHVENELKIAISLAGYPQNKLEGTHIRRLKQLFKEYLHKDMKSQRFTNLIIPKFQDVYLSNGAVIYICDSLETRDYLSEVLPKFINATGLKLVFRSIGDLVRYTRIVMRLPEKFAHIESVEILHKLQIDYTNLKPDCWKYYSDVAGKQKRQFGVDPESLEVIRNPDFDPTYEGEKICFRIIDRQKRDVSFEETGVKVSDGTENVEEKKIKDTLLRNMYCPIDPDLMSLPLTRIRTNHYTDIISDDLKLYVGPSNYPETRIDETLFHSIKRTLENVVFNTINKENFKSLPKIHDMYLFDGVIFIICKDMSSRKWIENSLSSVNSMLQMNLKATEFRGAVGIISMAVKTDKDTDEVIEILQRQNPRLRTKYWRKISTVRSKAKLDVVLQIDKLSAQVINENNFNKLIGNSAVQFTLGHLQSLLKPKASLQEMCKKRERRLAKETKVKSDVASQADVEFVNNNRFALDDKVDKQDFEEKSNRDKRFNYYEKDFDPKIINSDSPKSPKVTYDLQNNQDNYCKMIMKIPQSILPENKDDLSIIFDLLEDKNPGLNTELWQVSTDLQYTKGKITLRIDKQSASVIKGPNFDPFLAGEKLKFILQHT